jgi:hypothetical protein
MIFSELPDLVMGDIEIFFWNFYKRRIVLGKKKGPLFSDPFLKLVYRPEFVEVTLIPLL